jgi:hypothetical protein
MDGMAVDVGLPGLDPLTARKSPAEPIWYRSYRPLWMRGLNAVGRALDRARPRLDPDAMMAEARRRTGLDDFGDESFRPGLEVLVASFVEGTPHTFGRFFFREYCVRLLASRLRIERDFKRHPEILDVPIRRPIFVTGLPRSGTTFMHRLLAEDPLGRPLLFWETLEPSPPPERSTYATDPRIARARRSVRQVYSLAPGLAAAHLFEAESPEECNNLFAHAFAAGINGVLFDVPRYVEWLGEQDLVGNYRYLRRQLQLLTWRCGADHLVLKAPAHLFGLDAVLTVFPDAAIVVTHRDPLKVIPSLCSLSAACRGMISDHVDLRRTGVEYIDAMSTGINRALDVRASADPSRFFDVPYQALMADPVGVTRDVCGYFGYDFGTEFEARVNRWLVENPQHKHGVHRYSLEQFGLDAETLNTAFARYRAWIAENLKHGM